MMKVEKKVKLVNLVYTSRKSTKSVAKPIGITHDLYKYIFEKLPDYLLDLNDSLNKDKMEKTQIRVKTYKEADQEKSLYYHSDEDQCICGIIEKGITGKTKTIFDSSTNEEVGIIKRFEAVLSPVFFTLFFSYKLNSLFLLTENDTSENIFKDLASSIRSAIINYFGTDKITMKSDIVLGSDKLIDYIKEGVYTQIKIIRKKIPSDIADSIYNVYVEEDDDCTIELRLKSKNNPLVGKLVDTIKNIGSDGSEIFKAIPELEVFGLDENSDIIIDTELNGNKRPISISKMKTPHILQVINVNIVNNENDDFISMREECISLFKDIIKYK